MRSSLTLSADLSPFVTTIPVTLRSPITVVTVVASGEKAGFESPPEDAPLEAA